MPLKNKQQHKAANSSEGIAVSFIKTQPQDAAETLLLLSMLLLLLSEVANAEAENSMERRRRRRRKRRTRSSAVYLTRVLVARLSFTTGTTERQPS